MHRNGMRRVSTLTLCLVAGGLLMRASAQDAPAGTVPNWVAERGISARQTADAIVLERRGGWLRSERVYSDFQFSVEFRVAGTDAAGSLGINSWPGYEGAPGYQVPLTSLTDGTDALGRLRAVNHTLRGITFDRQALEAAKRPADAWQQLRIDAKGNSLRVFVNEALVSTAAEIDERGGYLAWSVRDGRLEFRSRASPSRQ